MQGSREAVIIAEGIHMLNPLLFDPIRDRATGIYVAPRTRIITPGDRIIHPEQVRVARRMIRNYQGRGNSLRDTILCAESVNAGEQKYIAPTNPTPPSTSTRSTITSCAFWQNTCARSHSSRPI